MGSLAIVGLEQDVSGAYDSDVLDCLRAAGTVVVSSADGAPARCLSSLGIAYASFEDLGIGPDSTTGEIIEGLLRYAASADAATSRAGTAGSDSSDVLLVWGEPPAVSGPAPGSFDELMALVGVLRSPGGCPWDREQTHESLGASLIEEAYETVVAIESGDRAALAEELGDVLLQVALHAEIGAGDGTFTVGDVLDSIIAKIRRRHPHVFGTASAETAEDVTRVWDAVKRDEKPHAGVLGEVAHAMPALMRAQKISRRAASAGFEWENLDGVWAKVHEEIEELKACEPGSSESADELGDVLFTLVNVARKMGIDAESALRTTCERFTRRFLTMERDAAEGNKVLEELGSDEWDELWERAKTRERGHANRSDERKEHDR